jgi:hypothetical protein
MTIDQLADELERIEAEEGNSKSSTGSVV